MPSQQLREIIDLLNARARANQGKQLTLDERRAGTDEGWKLFENLDDISTQAVDAGGVLAEWVVAPGVNPDNVMLYLHGGGYVVGSIVSHRGLAANLSRATESRVLLIDYRLAPEHPFPAAVEDAITAYRWLVANGTEPSRMVVSGDSSGGGLTVALLVALRDAGDQLPSAGVCISPWVDMEAIGKSMMTRADRDPVVQREVILDFAKAYLGDADPRSPLAAPLYADLTGLPPLLVQVGTAETLLDDATRLADHAKAAGVQVTLESWEDMIHIWHRFGSKLSEAQQAINRIGEYVGQVLAANTTSCGRS